MKTMYDFPNKAKPGLSEPSQRRKKKLKKSNYQKNNVTIDEWAYLEWTCVDNFASKISE
jgi:hypothetical protein